MIKGLGGLLTQSPAWAQQLWGMRPGYHPPAYGGNMFGNFYVSEGQGRDDQPQEEPNAYEEQKGPIYYDPYYDPGVDLSGEAVNARASAREKSRQAYEQDRQEIETYADERLRGKGDPLGMDEAERLHRRATEYNAKRRALAERLANHELEPLEYRRLKRQLNEEYADVYAIGKYDEDEEDGY